MAYAANSRAHRFDIVAVGIDQEGGEVGRAVIGPRARAAIVAAAGFDALGVEFLDRGVIRRAERDMGAGAFQTLVQIEPKRGLALRPEACAAFVLGTQDVTERGKGSVIKAHGSVEIADF